MKPRIFPALPDPNDRVETGPIRFGDDYAGIFIRGDDSFHYAIHLSTILDDSIEEGAKIFSKVILKGLLNDLYGCDERTFTNE